MLCTPSAAALPSSGTTPPEFGKDISMRTTRLSQRIAFAGVLLSAIPSGGAELLPPTRPFAEVIDYYIDLKLHQGGVAPAPQADDPTLVRRLYLDLAGRIPTRAEARTYASSRDADKREKLISALMNAPEFARHNATEFDAVLRNNNPEAPSVRDYLLAAFRENRPWDKMFRELMGTKAASHHPEQFITRRLKDPDALPRDVSSVFFGLNISCAQCHRHPHISTLTQDFYYGMKGFFAPSFEFQNQLLERQYVPPVVFKSKGETHTARLLFLNGATIDPPAEKIPDLNKAIQEESKRIDELNRNFSRDKQLPPAPTFSPRGELVELALKAENRELFARAMVNRLWKRFYGRGLVMRVDQMHAQNRPSHPELLDWLTRDFIEHRYDLARLIRGLVSSKAYSRTSCWEKGDAPPAALFAVAAVRPLTPMQWGLSHRLASNPAILKPDQPPDFHDRQLDHLEKEAQRVFGKLIEQPRDDMQIGITEALRLSNDAALLQLTGDQLVAALLALKNQQQQITEAYWTVLSRPPSAAESALLATYLQQHKGRPSDAMAQAVWALFNGPEFRFNH
jgi:hypothetical protein